VRETPQKIIKNGDVNTDLVRKKIDRNNRAKRRCNYLFRAKK
jgi:hypothetical protein